MRGESRECRGQEGRREGADRGKGGVAAAGDTIIVKKAHLKQPRAAGRSLAVQADLIDHDPR